jgi:hypothetical protein
MKLGIAAEAVLAACRVGDSPPNGVSPLMPYLALIVVFAQRCQRMPVSAPRGDDAALLRRDLGRLDHPIHRLGIARLPFGPG